MATDFAQWLTRQYIKPAGKIQAMCEKDQPFLSMIKKVENRGGEDFRTPAYITTARGWARTRAQAQAIAGTAAGNGTFGVWANSAGSYSGDVQFSDREISQSQGMSDSGFVAFAESQKTKVEGLWASFGGIMSRLILNSPGAYLFQISAITSGVMTLEAADAERISDVEVGDQLDASTADGTSGAVRGAIGYVIGVNRDGATPTVTVSATAGGSAGTPTDWAADDFIFRVGEFGGAIDTGPNGSGGAGNLIIDSIQSWIPATALTNTFKGVDRGVDSRLTGVRQTAGDVASGGFNIEETLEELATKGRSRFGWKGQKTMFLHTTRFKQLSRSLETRRLRGLEPMKYDTQTTSGGNSGKAYASFSYNKIVLQSQSGAYNIVDEPNMDQNLCIALDPKDWEIRCLEGFPQTLNKDSNEILRKTDTDDYSLRAKLYASFMLATGAMISQSGRTALPDPA